jgi:methylenetetrahydrofolate--tRNA-(uracil-5-)-methyltransferase
VRTLRGDSPIVFPAETAIGALCRYVSTPQKHFAPMNINFGLLPPLDVPQRTAKDERQRLMCERALELCRPVSTLMV